MRIFTSNTTGLFCEAQSLSKQDLTGSRGTFQAYTVGGNTYPLRIQLKALGFNWWPTLKVWYIAADKFSEVIRQKLVEMGVAAGIENAPPAADNTMQVPQAPQAPQQAHPAQQAQPRTQPALQATEDPDLTRWYGFPINHKIAQFNVEIEMDGEKHVEPVTIDRLCVFGGDTYHKTKSREHKLHPKYVVSVGQNTLDFNKDGYTFTSSRDEKEEKYNRVAKLTFIKKENWGTYDEAAYIEYLKGIIKARIENNPRLQHPSSSHYSMTTYYDYAKRQEDLKELLKQEKFKRDGLVELTEGGYAGKYNVEVEAFAKEQEFDVYVRTAVDHPLARHPGNLGSLPLYKVHTVPEFEQKLQEFCNSPKVKEAYLKYLQSFPFLQEQQEQGKQEFDSIKWIMDGGANSAKNVLQTLQEMGYVRASKRQKQEVGGMTKQEDIKWVVESKKIVNDAYSYDFKATMPSFFYTVIAYSVHRKIRGISSFTDMMLVDAMDKWKTAMNRFGLTMDFRQINSIIEEISNAIVAIIYGKKTKEQRNQEFRDWFDGRDGGTGRPTDMGSPEGLSEFKQFAEKLGLDTEDIEDTAKNIYRTLTKLLHPDLFPAEQKVGKEAQFKELQQIWDKVPPQYKQAASWYSLYLTGSLVQPLVKISGSNWFKMAKLIEIDAITAEEARHAAVELSRQHPGKYITIVNNFGLFLSINDRLHVFAPSDAHPDLRFYYLNGIEKPFSKAQIIRDQNQTPTMS